MGEPCLPWPPAGTQGSCQVHEPLRSHSRLSAKRPRPQLKGTVPPALAKDADGPRDHRGETARCSRSRLAAGRSLVARLIPPACLEVVDGALGSPEPWATEASTSRSSARRAGLQLGSTFAVSSSRPAASGSSPNSDSAPSERRSDALDQRRLLRPAKTAHAGEQQQPDAGRQAPRTCRSARARPPPSQSVQVSSVPLSFSIRILHAGPPAQPCSTSLVRGWQCRCRAAEPRRGDSCCVRSSARPTSCARPRPPPRRATRPAGAAD